MMKYFLIAAIAALPAWGGAVAQDIGDLRVRVGVGVRIIPKYVGADSYQVAPLVDFDFARGSNEFAFEAPDYGFGIPVVSTGGFSFGPAGSIATKRKESDVGAPVGKVNTTIEVGAS